MGIFCSKTQVQFHDVQKQAQPLPEATEFENVAVVEKTDKISTSNCNTINSDNTALISQIKALKEKNEALQLEITALERDLISKPSISSYKQLQNENSRLQEQVLSFELVLKEKESSLQAQLGSRGEAEALLAELQEKYDNVKTQNQNLKRRMSDWTTGHAEQRVFQAIDSNLEVLMKIRLANPASKLHTLWSGDDYKRWEGVRIEGGLVTGLALSGLQICVIPPELGTLTSLTTLFLSNNDLEELPRSIGNLTHLTSLFADGNRLSSLPEESLSLPNLSTLWLQDNFLTAVPPGISRMVQLRQLLLSNNRLSAVPSSLGEMTSLTSLWLDHNELAEVPASLSKLSNLRRLRIDARLMEGLPTELQSITRAPKSRTTSCNGADVQPAVIAADIQPPPQ